MRELPILMNCAMVRAVLDGRKTATRRLIDPQPANGWAFEEPPMLGTITFAHPRRVRFGAFIRSASINGLSMTDLVPSPYGGPGDRLYVRETWSSDFANHYPHDRYWYRADDDRQISIEDRDGVRSLWSPESREWVPFRWRPSIHMPKEAARIWLEVTAVRVERLQDISEDQAIAEGIHRVEIGSGYPDRFGATPVAWIDVIDQQARTHEDPRLAYRDLWEAMYGAGSWAANPWVWVVEFRRVDNLNG